MRVEAGGREGVGGKEERKKQVFWNLPCPVLYRVLLTESQLAAPAAEAPFIEV